MNIIAVVTSNSSSIFVLANIILGFTAATFELLCVVMLDDKLYRWLKILYTILCLYWAIIYVVVLVSIITGLNFTANAQFGNTFVRPGITYTLALIGSGAIYRYRILRKRREGIGKIVEKANGSVKEEKEMPG